MGGIHKPSILNFFPPYPPPPLHQTSPQYIILTLSLLLTISSLPSPPPHYIILTLSSLTTSSLPSPSSSLHHPYPLLLLTISSSPSPPHYIILTLSSSSLYHPHPLLPHYIILTLCLLTTSSSPSPFSLYHPHPLPSPSTLPSLSHPINTLHLPLSSPEELPSSAVHEERLQP